MLNHIFLNLRLCEKICAGSAVVPAVVPAGVGPILDRRVRWQVKQHSLVHSVNKGCSKMHNNHNI